jgi:hypothetical protein
MEGEKGAAECCRDGEVLAIRCLVIGLMDVERGSREVRGQPNAAAMEKSYR